LTFGLIVEPGTALGIGTFEQGHLISLVVTEAVGNVDEEEAMEPEPEPE
jgi:hypothetical protein